jgi:hypothetical protein
MFISGTDNTYGAGCAAPCPAVLDWQMRASRDDLQAGRLEAAKIRTQLKEVREAREARA